MKVLLSAKACDPYMGSESHVGWSSALALAKDHDLWVLTGSRNRAPLERAETEGLIPKNIRFIYAGSFGRFSSNRMWARFQDWGEYASFARAILPIARRLHREVKFDVAHHVTIATWRIASPLWKLGIPFAFGPVGGAERFPIRFLGILSGPARAFELCRKASNVISRLSPAVRSCICRASHFWAVNNETFELAKQMRGSEAHVTNLCHTFFSEEKIKAFTGSGAVRDPRAPLRLFAGGNLEGRKGAALALMALARVKGQGVKFRYRFGGGGPEAGSLRKLTAKLGLQEEVVFGDPLSGASYRDELAASHVFFFPSFREGSGVTLMEAMLAGCVPVVANCGGPGCIVGDDCGFKIPVTTTEQMVRDLAATLVMIDGKREMILQRSAASSRRIATVYSESEYRKAVGLVYGSMRQIGMVKGGWGVIV
jgi:glycosyltransferase involved in cell wall biosynthesis